MSVDVRVWSILDCRFLDYGNLIQNRICMCINILNIIIFVFGIKGSIKVEKSVKQKR